MTASPVVSVHPEAHAHSDPNHDIRVKRAHDYPQQIWFLLASFIGLLALLHIGALLVSWRRKRRTSVSKLSPESEKTGIHEEFAEPSTSRRVSLRRIPLAIITAFRVLLYRVTLPIGSGHVLNGAEICVIAGYITALFTWEFINCRNVLTGVKLDVAYWSDRAANIVATQLPLIVALAGKNNLISFVTGISYEKLNVLHRAAARACLVLIWVHFWGRVKIGLVGENTISHPWVRTGISVASAYTVLVLISVRPLRTRFYELFFFSHFFLVLVILIGAYFHIHKGPGFAPYLIPSFVFWALDRTLRLFRVFHANRPLSVSSHPLASLEATAELLSPNMVRLVLTRPMTWRPGQSAFITMPGVSNIPFEAHPFTIASIHRRKVFDNPGPDGSAEQVTDKEAASNEGNELVFLIQSRKGFTKRLRDIVRRQGGERGVLPLTVYVDGPYGCPPDLNAFDGVILIAGGSGITYTLPLLQDIVDNARRGRTACRKVLFLWAVPYRSNLSWVSRPLYETLTAVPSCLQVCLHIHVTQRDIESSPGSRDDSFDNNNIKEPEDIFVERLLQSDEMSLESGRPDVEALLEEELRDAKGYVSVDVAGPAGLASSVREALRGDIAGPKAVLKGGPAVTLHVETYGIA